MRGRRQWAPDTPGEFECDPSYVVDITTAASQEAQLGPDRRSTKYTGDS